MTDLLIVPITDLIKHYVYVNYLSQDDYRMTMLLYSLLGTVLAVISTYITKYSIFNLYRYIKWHITYSIFNRKILICPTLGQNIDTMYSPYTMNTSAADEDRQSHNICEYLIYGQKSVSFFLKTMCKFYEDKVGSNNNVYGNIVTFCEHNDRYVDYNKLFTFKEYSEKISPLPQSGIVYIAYVDGYLIYLDYNYSNDNYITLNCKQKQPLDRFKEFIKENHDKFFERRGEGGLEIYEVNSGLDKSNEYIGLVKPQLTFGNYVSRHKEMIITHLDAFRNNKITQENIFIDNNLGFLLHGTYGTGKTFFISAVANYLNRSVLTINFVKVKTKSKFRQIMTQENVSKYVICFDEFDYLLTNVIDNDVKQSEADVKFKIKTLSEQLVGLKDNKPGFDQITNEIKTLMEGGISDNLTYEFILSELSGITGVHNRVIVATTNFVEKIPKALLRPGRFDIILHLDKFNKAEIIELLIKLYNPSKEVIRTLDKVKFKENYFTPSDIIINKHKYNIIEEMLVFLSDTTTVSNVDNGGKNRGSHKK